MSINVTVKLNGGLFSKDLERLAQKQIKHEVLSKIEERLQRGGKGITEKRNETVTTRKGFGTLEAGYTLRSHRRTGTSKQSKWIGQARAMAPRVAKKAAERIAAELAGGA